MNRSSSLSRRSLLCTALAFSLTALSPAFAAQQEAGAAQMPFQVTISGWTLTLRPPTNLYAGAEAILYLRIQQNTGGDNEAAVPFARIQGKALLDGSAANDKAATVSLNYYPGGVTGDYALVGTFPTVGTYTLTVEITPPGGDNKPIEAHFTGVTVKPADAHGKEEQESPFSLKIEATPDSPLPGEAVDLRISIVDTRTKKRVVDFEPIYDSPLQLYVLREDVSELRHEKPERIKAAVGSKDDGIFTLTTVFPTGGKWNIFAEVAPKGEGAQLLTAKMEIPGARALPEPLMAQVAPLIRQNGLTMRYEKQVRFVARQTVPLTIHLEDNEGQPISDLQLLDGVLAHLYFADKEGKNFVHTLPDTSDPISGRAGTGLLTFPVRFPRAGIYRAWLTLLRNAQTITISFVVKVADK